MSKKPYSDLSRAGKYIYLQDLEKKRKTIEDESEVGPSQIQTAKVPRLFEASNGKDDALLPMDDPLPASAVANFKGVSATGSDFEIEDRISKEALQQDDHVPRVSSSSQMRVDEMSDQGNACSNDIVENEMMDQAAGSISDVERNLAYARNEQSKKENVPDEKNDSDNEIEETSDEQSNENNDSDVMELEDEMEPIGEDSDKQDNESSDPDDEEQGNEIRDETDEEEVDGDDAREQPQPPPRNENNHPLYAGARITVAESMLLILSLLLKHNITGTCLSDIITVINLHCLAQGLKSNSLYKFRKYFSASQKQFNKHFYCLICLSSLESENTMCVTCNANKGVSYFIEMPFLEQLKEMFNREGFYELLQHRFHRQGVTPGTICDIYDGSLYSRYEKTGFLSNANNISLTWYTDGIPVFKSSKVSMWPVYLGINELPYKYRMKRENTMLAALWCGNKKPTANSFIYTLRSEFQKLLRGTPCTLADGRVVNVQGMLLAGTCDLPAKAQFLNMTAYNGQFGCPNCTNPGESFIHPTGGTSHVYRYEPEPEMRTSAETNQNADQALLTGRAVNGVKGPCSFSKLMPDFIGGMAIDIMHGIFCGVTKRLLSLWFDPSFSSRPFSLVSVTAMINKKLLQLKPPKFVHRMPRSVEELCHWKASELKMWFFYYSLPVLAGIMRPDYFEHYLLLVTAIALLNSERITRLQLSTAKNLLHKFVRQFEDSYGLQFSTINIHQLLHLPVCVERLGPLWVYSCFPYEDLNGKLLSLVHGTSNIESQIASAHIYLLKMKIELDQLPPGPIRDFATDTKRQVKICQRLFESCYSIGTYKKYDILPNFLEQAILNSGLPLGNVQSYMRLLKDGNLIIGEIYTRVLKTSSSYVLHNGPNNQKQLGTVPNFIKIFFCDCARECFCEGQLHHYAVITQIVGTFSLHASGDNRVRCELPYLHKCRRTDTTLLIPLREIESVCVSVSINDELYIGTPVNFMELE